MPRKNFNSILPFRATNIKLPVPPRYKMNENETKPNPGDFESIWNSSISKSTLQSKTLLFILGLSYNGPILQLKPSININVEVFDSSVKQGEEWGSLLILEEPTSCGPFRAKIGKLFNRDIFMGVIRTMVFHAFKPLWVMPTYKVYPGFWGVEDRVYPGLWSVDKDNVDLVLIGN